MNQKCRTRKPESGLANGDFQERICSKLKGKDMLKPGTRIRMTKGYKGVEGVIVDKTNSCFEFYIIELNNGINIIVGPSAFVTLENSKESK